MGKMVRLRRFAARLGKAWMSMSAALVIGMMALTAAPLNLQAGETWDYLKPDVFGDRPILDGKGIVLLKAPDRPEDQRKVPVQVIASLLDGRTIKSVTIVLDENPMPVSAVFDIGGARTHVDLGLSFRLGRATDIRAVVETSDGKLYMTERFVKFAGGQSACTAPPEGNPEEILANMGKMSLSHEHSQIAATLVRPKVHLVLSHPNHTGMVLDPVTLYYTPMRMVEEVVVSQGEERVFTMHGSITLSQDPTIDFDYKVNGAQQLSVVFKDTDNTKWTKTFPINQGS